MQNRVLLVEDDDELRELRTQTHLPVVPLTARGDETDRIVGFEVGADDYLPKPCNPRELVARLQALRRRIAWDQKTEVNASRTYGDLRIETVRGLGYSYRVPA